MLGQVQGVSRVLIRLCMSDPLCMTFVMGGTSRGGSRQDTTSHKSEWPSSKILQTINAGEGVEKREPSYIVDGNAN